MKYKEYKGPIEDLILGQLEEIEKRENVRILHAAESGSRAWGIASLDSDYDVRFIYVRPLEYYLGLQGKKDFIDWAMDEILDINGWDLSKVLQHIHKSNATMYEWANSPLVYRTTAEWADIKEEMRECFSSRAAMYHYYGTAKKNYSEYLNDGRVKYKKYFYVLRPILACKWIEERDCPPPVSFQELADAVLEEEMRPIIEKLLEQKQQMKESEKGERIDKLNNYIQRNLEYFKQKAGAVKETERRGWDKINEIFLKILYQKCNDKM